jgi:hypothetical protein
MRILWPCLSLIIAACAGGNKAPSVAAAPSSSPAYSAEASANSIPDSLATKKPALIKPGKGRFPPNYEYRQITATAKYQFVVTETGSVDPTTVQVLEATAPAFATAGTQMIESSRFSPGELDGKPVRVRVKQRVTWNLPPGSDCRQATGTTMLPPKCIDPVQATAP